MGCERAGEGRWKMERGQGRGRGRRRRGKPGEEESAELKSGAENRGRLAGRAELQRSAGVSNGGKAGVGGPGGRRGRDEGRWRVQPKGAPSLQQLRGRDSRKEGASGGRWVSEEGGASSCRARRDRRTGRRGESRERFWGSTSLPKPPRSQAPRASPSSQIPVLGPWTQISWKTTHASQTSAAAAAPTRLVQLALPCEGGGFWSPAHMAPLARSAPAAPPPAVLGSRRHRTTSVREGAGGA